MKKEPITKQQVIDFITEQLTERMLNHTEDVASTPLHATGLGLDSLDTVELALLCEGKFEIIIPDVDLAKSKTIGDLADTILHEYNLKYSIA